jgi:hypothetical protein
MDNTDTLQLLENLFNSIADSKSCPFNKINLKINFFLPLIGITAGLLGVCSHETISTISTVIPLTNAP